MTTALDSIKRALRLLGVYSKGEEPSSDEAQEALAALNGMLDSFANDKEVIFSPTLDTIAWAPSVASYTVGATGAVVTTRPVTLLDSCYFDFGGVSYPLIPITIDEYNLIALKTLSSTVPQYIWYEATYPDATIHLYPIPNTAVSVKVWSNKALISIPTVNTVINLPPGYKDFIDFNLAERLAPEYQMPVPAVVAKQANLTRKILERTNYVPQFMGYPVGSLPSNSRFNIYTGQAR